MGGKAARRKGSRVERQIVKLHREVDIKAKRVPLSGAAEGYKGDIIVELSKGDTLQGEIKARKAGSGFTVIDGWLGDNDILFLKRDQRRPAVYMNWGTYQRLLEYVKRNRETE